MGNERVIAGHALRALAGGAAFCLLASAVCADDTVLAKGGRLQPSEVLKPAPHEGRLAPPHLSADWWLRLTHEEASAGTPDGSRQGFVRDDAER
ncbi:hypothetical protein [Rhizobium sp. KDH_Rht_773_N]